MKFVISFGFVLHLLFLVSIFYIYFRSPILTDLEAQNELPNPPAKRLVVFVADGLRAESLYEVHLNKTPFLADVILNRGISGISHTRVPTESRPGHIALFAGLYEDPSAIFKGWQENLVEFDHIFNRTSVTYSWGSPDIVPIFAKGSTGGKVMTFSYDPNDEDFSGQSDTTLLDEWVFERVKKFLEEEENVEKVKNKDKIVLFLHLLGLDTAGHVHKPNSKKFIENLIAVDKGIQQIYELIEKVTNDQKTSYLFTSDHGMTDRGSHGDGTHFETETPIIAWGAGVKNWNKIENFVHNQLHYHMLNKLVPRFDIEQADVTPLLASLIGVPVPVNNIGKLPHQYLNATTEFVANALKNNALQLLKQYKKLYMRTRQKKFMYFINDEEYRIENRVGKMEYLLMQAIKAKKYDEIPDIAETLMHVAIESIEFYQQYYKYELLVCLAITMTGWIYILVQQLYVRDHHTSHSRGSKSQQLAVLIVICLVFALIFFNYIQNTPSMVTLYFILPVITWYFVYLRKNYAKFPSSSKIKVFIGIFILLVTTELMILSFFHRNYLSVVLIGHCLYEMSISNSSRRMNLKLLASTLALAVFPALPSVEKDSKENYLLYLGILIWIVKVFNETRSHKFSKALILQLSIVSATSLNLIYIIFCLDNSLGVPKVSQSLCWILAGVSLVTPIVSPLNIKQRISAIENGLIIIFMSMSLSYEPLFFMAFVTNLKYWIEYEFNLHQENVERLDDLTFDLEGSPFQLRFVNLGDVRRVTKFLLYLLIALFGTGNIASISSFDPNWVRCYISTFSPFLMTILIILKLVMPILYLTCCLKALNVITKIKVQKLFIMILIICDVMCLNFLFLVKNRGSWLDIGTSISHFVIMEATVLVLSLLYVVATILTTFSLHNAKNIRSINNLPLLSKSSLD
ncbi:GPI ethanolamine phosphate transferase 1-like [Culicoides brevitarsis]|uniref:GPI ethanolamine phosphate transferase 1-like n=1 Tax=Culicoides brevitarsis TaxID=469753 RepID=UPI00307CB6BB